MAIRQDSTPPRVPDTNGSEIRLATRIARMMVEALIEAKPYDKRVSILAKLEGKGEALQARALTYENVYHIRGGPPFDQDHQKDEAAEAARILQRLAGKLLAEAADAQLSGRR